MMLKILNAKPDIVFMLIFASPTTTHSLI